MGRRLDDFASVLHAKLVSVLVRVESSSASEALASQLAAEVVAHLAHTYQGELVYMRPPPKYDEAAVMRDFDYRNHRAVCDKHQISRRTLYRIVRRNSGSST